MGVLDSIGIDFGGIGGAMETLKWILIGLLIAVVVITIVGIIVYRKIQNKKFNIPLIIITPRSDGRVVEINKGIGGYFKSKKVGGITSFRIKRPGIGIAEIPPPPSSYLSSPNRTLILAQKGIDDYSPVMPYQVNFVDTEMEVEENGIRKIVVVKQPILDLKAINQDATAWGFDNEETAKKRFTFSSLWDKYQGMITMMVFVFILFLILYINWMGMKDVVKGLKEVADMLRSATQPIITPGG
jgi:hypothetical protein